MAGICHIQWVGQALESVADLSKYVAERHLPKGPIGVYSDDVALAPVEVCAEVQDVLATMHKHLDRVSLSHLINTSQALHCKTRQYTVDFLPVG
jgi:hypothetical protein